VCSKRPEAEPTEPFKALVRPLASEPARVTDDDRDLKREVCTRKLEVKLKELDMTLKREDFSTKLDTSDIALDRDLNRKFFSARLVAEPSEPVRVTMRDFNTELERLNDMDRDLNSEDFSAKLEAELREPANNLTNPLF
jgi:hypothetical protein